MTILGRHTTAPRFSEDKHPLYTVIESTGAQTGQVIRGWHIYDPPEGWITTPNPERLSGCGMVSVLVLLFVFWPISCIPCCCSAAYNGFQVPVYENAYPITSQNKPQSLDHF